MERKLLLCKSVTPLNPLPPNPPLFQFAILRASSLLFTLPIVFLFVTHAPQSWLSRLASSAFRSRICVFRMVQVTASGAHKDLSITRLCAARSSMMLASSCRAIAVVPQQSRRTIQGYLYHTLPLNARRKPALYTPEACFHEGNAS
jgi:hypothetical protein